MKSEKRILLAFILNFAFSVFEFIGGIFSGSVAIISDAIHDIGDAASIGVSYFLEKKSKKQPDSTYTYGYGRYSVIGSVITMLILIIGSLTVIYNAVMRIISPREINYNLMMIFAIVGVCVNLGAALFTREGESLNQRVVSLHMLEDVLGWAVVLIGSIVMRFTNIWIIDPIMAVCVAVFIFISAVKGLKASVSVLLERIPNNICIDEIKEHILEIEGISDVHHIHIWSLDGQINCATMHIVCDECGNNIKERVREELLEHNIHHVTLELEHEGEHCESKCCHVEHNVHSAHHHHHHHH